MAFVIHHSVIPRDEMTISGNSWFYPIPADCFYCDIFYGIFKGLEV